MKKIILLIIIFIFPINSFSSEILCKDINFKKLNFKIVENNQICIIEKSKCIEKLNFKITDFNNIVIYKKHRTIAYEFFLKKKELRIYKKKFNNIDTINTDNELTHFLIFLFGRYELQPMNVMDCNFF